MTQLKDFITSAELAAQTGINRHTLLARIRDRGIKTLTIGRSILIAKEDAPKVNEPVTKPYGGRRP